jgi:glycerate kinase
MKKVILIPDSFKGTMSSAEICTVMAQAVQEYYPDAQVHSVPVADGGEGSVDSFLQAVGGEKVHEGHAEREDIERVFCLAAEEPAAASVNGGQH